MSREPNPYLEPDTKQGALALALAKAQAEFPAIVRDKEVDSRTYKFKYAPLDKIIDAVRPALTKHGLAFTQLLDEGHLVTMLLHESGGSLEGRCLLPQEGTIQQFGSAITYIRRYALQAMLGIAAEEDDDGDAAGRPSGQRSPEIQTAKSTRQPEPGNPDGSVVGVAEKGKGPSSDFELRQTPTGWRLGFRLVEGRKGINVIALDALAQLIADNRAAIEDFRVQCWGRISDESFTNSEKRVITYQVLNLERLKVGPLDLAAPDEVESLPMFEEAV